MQPVLAVALTAMHQDLDRLDRVALNLANATTTGYKRDGAITAPFVDALDQAAGAAAVAPELGLRAQPSTNWVDRRPGTLRTTSQPLDLALTEDGYFEIRTPEGVAYTRDGSFRRDEQGRLVTAQGAVVAGRDGDIKLSSATPTIDANGRVVDDDNGAGRMPAMAPQIKVVRFDDPTSMQRLGNGLLSAGGGMTVVDSTATRVRQGALENSNVSTMQEMVQMMQTMRHFESLQKVAQGCDEVLGTAIHKLGDLS